MNLEQLKTLIGRLPDEEKNKPIIVIKGELYTWNDIFAEIVKKGPLAEVMKNKIEELLK